MAEILDAIIIGSGPAGLTAAIYVVRGSFKTLILGGTRWGGQLMLTTTVENFPGFPNGIQGPQLMQEMRLQAERLGVTFVSRDVTEVNFSQRPFRIIADNIEYQSKSIIIATGAVDRWLGIPGEAQLIGRGVSSCAPCDAAFFKDKRVIVVGGGDSAMEEAIVLAKFATEVTIVHRGSKFRASQLLQERVFKYSKIKIIYDTQVIEIGGKDKVISARLKDNQHEWAIPIDGVFVAIGHDPATNIFRGKIEMDEKGYIKKISNYQLPNSNFQTMTSVEGVFVAGDVHDHHFRQAVTAAGFGCQAAMEAIRWLEEQSASPREVSGLGPAT